MGIDLKHFTDRIARMDCMRYEGEIERVCGAILEARGPRVPVGQVCEVHPGGGGGAPVKAQVIGFRGATTVLMPIEKLHGVQAGDRVVSCAADLEVALGRDLLGRVIDGLGHPIDGGGPILCSESAPIDRLAPHPLKRPPIARPFHTGIRAIDVLVPLGRGQRVGIFSGSGVGKSTLLGEIARGNDADVNVIALVGERGREVRHFLRENLGEEGLRRSVVVVATADAPPLLKVKAAYASTTIAEYFRGLGMDVLYVMDSLTRVATAQREIGLAAGEPPTTRGYPPSVFSLLPALAERLGNSEAGSITGLYSVLVERDDFNEPVADTVRATLDGHIVLSRALAERGQYPPIDALSSVSRVARDVAGDAHLQTARRLRMLLSTYAESEDLIKIGAYAKGTSAEVDAAIGLMPEMRRFLAQPMGEREPFEEALRKARRIAEQWPFA